MENLSNNLAGSFMEPQTCDELIRIVKIAQALTPIIIQTILPEICSLVDRKNPNITAEEFHFHNLCCSPIPTMIFNTTFEAMNTSTEGGMLDDACRYMTKHRIPDDEDFFQEFCNISMPKDPVKKPTYILLTYILLSILSPIGILANILILATVYKVKKLRNTTGLFICNLAVADLFVIIEVLSYYTLYQTGLIQKADVRVHTYLFPSLEIMLGSASLLHITAVSIERGIAVALPLRYPRYLSERRSKRLVIGIWVYCVILFFIGISRIWIVEKLYGDVIFYVAVVCSFFLPCVLVMTSYSVIMVSALKNMKMEKSIRKVIAAISIIDDNLAKNTSIRPARFREIKITFNVMTMTAPFVCGWGYFMICSTYEITTGYVFKGFQNWLIIFLPFLVSCLNPLTYILFTRSLRKNSLDILRRCFNTFKGNRESIFGSLSITSRHPSNGGSFMRNSTVGTEERLPLSNI